MNFRYFYMTITYNELFVKYLRIFEEPIKMHYHKIN